MTASSILLLLALAGAVAFIRRVLADMRRRNALALVGDLHPFDGEADLPQPIVADSVDWLEFEYRTVRCDGWIPVRVVDAECTEARHA